MSKPVQDRLEKIMSITLQEFEAGIKRLDGAILEGSGSGVYAISNGAIINFDQLEPVVLGGLMRLPRARITINTAGLPPDARQRFVALFDQTFQRGGG
jgi:hypothetical protein